jgi:hypothetical protein
MGHPLVFSVKERLNILSPSAAITIRNSFHLYAHVEEQHKEWAYKENSVTIHFSIAQVNKERKSGSFYA